MLSPVSARQSAETRIRCTAACQTDCSSEVCHKRYNTDSLEATVVHYHISRLMLSVSYLTDAACKCLPITVDYLSKSQKASCCQR